MSITQQGSKQGKEMLGNNKCLAPYLKLGKEASDKMVLGRELSDMKWGNGNVRMLRHIVYSRSEKLQLS